jgi:4-hydroxybutyryl-CoA dehydratase / vinylacetyl-CoA-Delta-isomerase
MALRTSAEYVESLRDDRTVWFRGERVADVTQHPAMQRGIRQAVVDFDFAHDPANRDLAVVGTGAGAHSRYFAPPRSADDLARRSALIEATTAAGRTIVPLVKEIGTDALFALSRIATKTARADVIDAFFAHCRDGDLAMSVAQTDVKGDRSKGPSGQTDPDTYLRIVDKSADGLVVRGAKVHTSCTPYVNELIVLPTRAMGEADRDWALSFAVPIATPGLSLVASPFGSTDHSAFDAPISGDRSMIETVTIFDDVLVPWDRVFLAGEADLAGPLALAFVDHHRFTAISYKLPLVDALVGTAALLADLNGITKAGHVRDKLTWLISYAETLRALVETAARRGAPDEAGVFVPDPLTVNIAKSHFAHGYHSALQHVQDIAGGLLVTAPGSEDFDNPATGPWLRRLLGGRDGVGGEERIRALKMASDLTTGELGGYHAVLAIHAEGSLEAEKLQTFRAYDPARAVAYARSLAGLS